MPVKGTTKNPAAKAAALSLLSKGLASQSEVATLAGESRQLIRLWAADIPTDKRRAAVLARLWREELAACRKAGQGSRPGSKP